MALTYWPYFGNGMTDLVPGAFFLIYPRHAGFLEPLEHFSLKEGLRLWVVPFDMLTDQFIWPDDYSESFLLQEANGQAA